MNLKGLMTAEQAKNISRSKDPTFAVETIVVGIIKSAEAGKYEYITRDYGFGTSTYCNEDKYPALCQEILKALRALGYQCCVHAKEGQFVDLWLSITWGETEVKP